MFSDLPPNSDTANAAVIEKYFSKLRGMSSEERLAKCISLSNVAREFVIAGIYSRHPGCAQETLKKIIAAHFLGEELATKYYSWTKLDGL